MLLKKAQKCCIIYRKQKNCEVINKKDICCDIFCRFSRHFSFLGMKITVQAQLGHKIFVKKPSPFREKAMKNLCQTTYSCTFCLF